MSWHGDGKIHISWGPDGEKLSPKEKEERAAELMACAQKGQEMRERAQKALEGLPYVAVPIEQLTSIYERMLRLTGLGQSKVEEFHTLPAPLLALRRAVFNEADFGAVFAGQWLPKEVRTAARERVQAEERAKNDSAALA